MTGTAKSDPALYEAILAGMSHALAAPTEQVPSVRCLSRSTLNELIGELVQRLPERKNRRPSVTEIIDHLVRARLLQAVPFADAAERVGTARLYSVGLGVHPETLHPFELLQAHVPDGIVCYMSALEVHQLTTQPTAYHHIARRTPPRPSRPSIQPSENANQATPPLGQWQFTVQGLRYYLTSRDPRYLQAFQTRYLDDKCWYKVTTLEQTLIDTLHRPMNCGGPAAVFEAWETAVERMDVTKLVGLLNQIKDRRLFQRAGYLLEAHGIDGVLPLADEDVGEPPVPLFAGIPFTRHSKRWGLLIP